MSVFNISRKQNEVSVNNASAVTTVEKGFEAPSVTHQTNSPNSQQLSILTDVPSTKLGLGYEQ